MADQDNIAIKDHEQQIDENYDFFQANLADLMKDHAGQWVLIERQKIISFHDTLKLAYLAGREQFGEMGWSVQEITDQPVYVGTFHHA